MEGTSLFLKVRCYIIDASTGCTCCSYDKDHKRGPYSTIEAAELRVKEFQEMPLLASQYASHGIYRIFEEEGEQLPDGRIICGNKVFPGFWDLDKTLEERIPNQHLPLALIPLD